MRTWKIILLGFLFVFTVAYLAFLFVLPYAINLDKYTPQITEEIQKNTGFQVKIKGLKVITAWNLSGGAQIEKTDFIYPTGEKFAQINNLDMKLSLLPLLFGKISVDSINLGKLFLDLKVEKSGKFLIEKHLPKISKSSAENQQFPFKFSDSMPNIRIKTYRVSFIDSQSSKTYSVKGQDFKVSDFVLNKKIKIKTKGQLILKDREQVSYDLSLFSKLFPLEASVKQKKQPQSINIMDVFEEIYKYNLKALIKADLKVSGNIENPEIKGLVDFEKVSFTLGGKTLPESDLKLEFRGDKVKIDSNLYTGLNEKAVVTGVFVNGKKKSVDLNVKSDKTDIANVFLFSNTLLKLFGIKQLEGITAKGDLSAKFNVNSDFKTIRSSGFLRVNNASIVHDLYNVSLNSITADVDFSNNNIRINKSSAKLNGKPITIKGTVDSSASADIFVFAQNLQLKGLLLTLGQIQMLRENDILDGLVDIKASIKGRLDRAVPTIDITAKNINLKNKPNKIQIKLATADIKAVSTGKNHDKFKGNIQASGIKILTPPPVGILSVPVARLSFDEKNLKIDKALLYLNSSKIDIFGNVNNYSNPKINIDVTAKGLMVAKDMKSMLPTQNRSGVEAVGKIPLLVRVTGGQKQEVYVQILANRTNHLAIFDTDTLRGKTSLVNARMTLQGDDLNIHEAGVYSLKSTKGLSLDMKANSSSGYEIASLSGKVSNVNSLNPVLRGVSINIPNQISTSIPGYSNSTVKIKGDLSLNGSVNNLEVKGYLSLPLVELPTIKTSLKSLGVHFNKDTVSVNCPQLQVSNSLMGFNSIVNSNFSKGIVVENVDFYSSYMDLDSLASALSNLPQNANGPGCDIGIKILDGKAHINKVRTGGIVVTNVSSGLILNKNILKMTNVMAEAYTGKVAGTIGYNLIYGNINLDISGRGLSAGPAIKGLTGMSDKITGQLDFDSDISLSGAAQQQLLKNLKGTTRFVVSNGKMGTLGKFEHLLYAQNILSNNLLKTTVNVIAKAVSVKNTGVFKYLKGEMNFSNGWANLNFIKTSGPSMSMYITGRYGLLDNSANLVILGRLSDDVVRILGPIGDFSVDKVLSKIPKLGEVTSYLINQMTTNPEYENTSMIPYLTPKTELPTKEFKVVLNGGIESQSSVKSFKWLSKPTVSQASASQGGQRVHTTVRDTAKGVIQQVLPKYLPSSTTTTDGQTNYVPPKKIIAPVADFINSLPDLQ